MSEPRIGVEALRPRVARAVLRSAAIGVALLLASCDSVRPPPGETVGGVVAPSPIPPLEDPDPAIETSTLAGTVHEHATTGVRPVPALALRVSGNRAGSFTTVDAVSDAEGRYEVPGFDRGTYLRVSVVVQTAYLSPCSAQFHLWSGQALEVHVVERTELETNGTPRSMPAFERARGYNLAGALTGRVSERTADGDRPVMGALVEHLYGRSDRFSGVTGFTLTNAEGEYVLCGYDDDYGQSVRVSKDGYRTMIEDFGPSWNVDVEVARE